MPNCLGSFSHFLALFHTVSHLFFQSFFRIFPPGLSLRIKGFYYCFSSENQREKDRTILHVSCCTFFLLPQKRGMERERERERCCSMLGLRSARKEAGNAPRLSSLTLQSLFFWKKQGFFPQKARVFLFAEPLKSLEKRGKTHKKAREIGKRKKQGNRKKQGLEGQG